jgi:hypothetical protein
LPSRSAAGAIPGEARLAAAKLAVTKYIFARFAPAPSGRTPPCQEPVIYFWLQRLRRFAIAGITAYIGN